MKATLIVGDRLSPLRTSDERYIHGGGETLLGTALSNRDAFEPRVLLPGFNDGELALLNSGAAGSP